MRGGGSVALVTALVTGVVTFAVALLPRLRFAGGQPSLHVALETAASLIALLAGFLIIGRLRRACLLNELLLASGFALLALLNLFLVTVPALMGQAPRDVVAWAALAGGSLGAVLVALAAFVPRMPLRRPGLVVAGGAAGVAAAALAAVFAGALTERSPRATTGWPSPRAPAPPELHAHTAVLASHSLITLLYVIAAAGFLARARRLGDEFFGWLCIAAVFAAASHASYLLHPSLYSPGVHVGDVFRLCFYAVLLAGSMREIWSYWHALSQAAVAEERRRIACDLHDGLAQELAYLVRNLDAFSRDSSGDTLRRLRSAVERAQFESRRVTRALAAPAEKAIDSALAEAVGEIADRFAVDVDLDLVPGVRLPAKRAEALVRIACEAVTNAARHSGSGRVRLSMQRHGPQVWLRVSDTGRGFDTTVPGGGFGLAAMCERARSVGGELRISSVPGRGSEVEVAL